MRGTGPSYPNSVATNGGVGKTLGKIGNFLKNPAGVPQDSAGNYKYIRNNRSGPAGTNPNYMPSYKKGGKVKKTGLALLHKGEKVLTVKQAKSKALKKMCK